MATLTIKPGNALRGQTTVPGDKSISHRALMLGGIAKGTSQIRGWLPAGDTKATLNCMRALGVNIIQHDDTTLTIEGGHLQPPDAPLDFVNAGTGIRLMAGLLAGQPFPSVLDGSAQLRRRPMGRVTQPLRHMNANITDTDGKAPLHIQPAKLKGMHYQQTTKSAQVKSCVLLAALYADSPTTVIEIAPGRDHTENMMRAMGVPLTVNENVVTIEPFTDLQPLDLTVPADFSSAAFLLVGASIVPGSDVMLLGINTNDRRTGLLDILGQMGASITLSNAQMQGGEPVADMHITAQALQGVTVGGDTVVRMIDEFPALMVAATQAKGRTVVQDAEELRVKETDRIAVMAQELQKLGVRIEEYPDGFAIDGQQRLQGAVVDSHDDHRIGMSLAIAALLAEGETHIEDAGCIHDSFPGFEHVLEKLGAELLWQN